MKTPSQERTLHQLFKSGIKLTRMRAMLELGIGNLPASVERMRHKMGIDVKGQWITTVNGKKIMQYYMES